MHNINSPVDNRMRTTHIGMSINDKLLPPRDQSQKGKMDFGGYGVWICISLGLIQLVVYIIYTKRKKNAKQMEVPPGTVILYQIGRGPNTPSASPFPLKLETYLRMNKILYMNDHTATFSKKGKTPWMTYNGQVVADSQFCIDFLADTLHLDPNAHLTDNEKAIARAFLKLIEENLYWTMCHEMFMKKENRPHIESAMPYTGLKLWLILSLMTINLKKEMWGHGIGRHSDLEIWHIAERDLRAVAAFLGDKPFLMGDEPSEVDCAVFGMIAEVRWHMTGSRHTKLLHDELTNLLDYTDRMRDRYWPDWDANCRSSKGYQDDSGKLYFQDGVTL